MSSNATVSHLPTYPTYLGTYPSSMACYLLLTKKPSATHATQAQSLAPHKGSLARCTAQKHHLAVEATLWQPIPPYLPPRPHTTRRAVGENFNVSRIPPLPQAVVRRRIPVGTGRNSTGQVRDRHGTLRRRRSRRNATEGGGAEENDTERAGAVSLAFQLQRDQGTSSRSTRNVAPQEIATERDGSEAPEEIVTERDGSGRGGGERYGAHRSRVPRVPTST